MENLQQEPWSEEEWYDYIQHVLRTEEAVDEEEMVNLPPVRWVRFRLHSDDVPEAVVPVP